MNSFRVVCTETSEVRGEFENLAYADLFAKALDQKMCQSSKVERWTGREWVALLY